MVFIQIHEICSLLNGAKGRAKLGSEPMLGMAGEAHALTIPPWRNQYECHIKEVNLTNICIRGHLFHAKFRRNIKFISVNYFLMKISRKEKENLENEKICKFLLHEIHLVMSKKEGKRSCQFGS